MADQTRQVVPGDTGAARDDDRERSIESLLVTGLDLYFAGDYERAIHAWTRVLFLDRSHARARAYIERARTVLAERQRETDELLHRGLAALDAGDVERARDLLATAVERGGPVEAAQAALGRLDRLGTGRRGGAMPGHGSVASGPDAPGKGAVRSSRLGVRILAVAAVLSALVIAATFALRWQGFEGWGRGGRPPGATATPSRPDPPLPHPHLADLMLSRARTLFARGHLNEALVELQAIDADDPRRPEADRLQADIQRKLLAAVESPSRDDAQGSVSGRP